MAENIVPFDFNGFEIRTLGSWTDPLFVAVDVCAVLELSNVSKACESLDDDEKLISPLVIAGQNRDVLCLTESGLYSLVLRSRKKQAKVFKKWLTSEVIPSIRKTGKYEVGQLPPADVRLSNYTDSLKFLSESLGLELDNPRYQQELKDFALNLIIGNQKQISGDESQWLGVVEIAIDMGYKASIVNQNRSQLGKFVASFGFDARKEKRLCNGANYPINLYLDCEELRETIGEFMDAKVLASVT